MTRLNLLPIAGVFLALAPPASAQQGQSVPQSGMTQGMADHNMNAFRHGQDEQSHDGGDDGP